ncbi:hypothetical protein B9Z55_016072 [Caenorhabditis nigoni]|nr:hypothetical protein B9Z55_016072 [Caenorhabditis nigoni]
MLILFIICLSLGTNALPAPNKLHKITKGLCDKEDELAKISCMSVREHEQIWGGMLKYQSAYPLNSVLIKQAVEHIAREELRKALNLPPPHPWGHYNSTEPSDAELASAPTIEAYFDLKEPRLLSHSLDNTYFFEHNFPPAIEFLDRRVPVIRTIFNCRFSKVRPLDSAGVTDKKTIDRMVDEFSNIGTVSNRVKERLFDFQCVFNNL